MALSPGFSVCALAVIVSSAACGGGAGSGDAKPAATQPAPPGEPVFKPVDPATPAILPMPPPGAAPAPTALPGGSDPTAMVTDLATGWPIALRVGQSMTARLTADRAAGLRWSLRPGTDAGIMSVAGEPVYEAAAGSAGVEVFRLIAVKPGQTTLAFDYRKGSDPAPLKSVSYPVTVQ